jgi:hypothetical protein
MKREIAEAWIADLRTNPRQTTGMLFDGRGHCCLGRLCLVVGATFENKIEEGGNYGPYPVLDGTMLEENEMLPFAIQKLAGMASDNGAYGTNALTHLNDNGVTLAKIADIIEKHWEKL